MNIEKEKLENVVKVSFSHNEVLRNLEYKIHDLYRQQLKRILEKYNIDVSHFVNYKHWTEILIKSDSSVRQRVEVLRRAMADAGIKHECKLCGLGPIWNNCKLVLQIDHINGDYTDNRIDNIRYLCPNCHTQTENFGAKSPKIQRKPSRRKRNYCIDCNQEITLKAIRCAKCFGNKIRKIEIPTIEVFKELSEKMSGLAIAKLYNVDWKTVDKWYKMYQINKKPVGYWSRKGI